MKIEHCMFFFQGTELAFLLSVPKTASACVSRSCAADSRPDTELLYHPSLARSHCL